MVKSRLNFKSVKIDTNFNKDGELYNRVYVNFNEDENNYYRLGSFISFAEKNIFKTKYNLDLETVQIIDFSSHVSYVELVKDENKFGVRMYLVVHFDIGYDKQFKLDNDDYFLLSLVYKAEKSISSVPTQNQVNNAKK